MAEAGLKDHDRWLTARSLLAGVPALLDQLTQAPASFMADGAYDRAATCDAILAQNPFARFIIPPCKGAVPGPAAIISPTSATRISLLWTSMGG
jgi:hypothetical protein